MRTVKVRLNKMIILIYHHHHRIIGTMNKHFKCKKLGDYIKNFSCSWYYLLLYTWHVYFIMFWPCCSLVRFDFYKILLGFEIHLTHTLGIMYFSCDQLYQTCNILNANKSHHQKKTIAINWYELSLLHRLSKCNN